MLDSWERESNPPSPLAAKFFLFLGKKKKNLEEKEKEPALLRNALFPALFLFRYLVHFVDEASQNLSILQGRFSFRVNGKKRVTAGGYIASLTSQQPFSFRCTKRKTLTKKKSALGSFSFPITLFFFLQKKKRVRLLKSCPFGRLGTPAVH